MQWAYLSIRWEITLKIKAHYSFMRSQLIITCTLVTKLNGETLDEIWIKSEKFRLNLKNSDSDLLWSLHCEITNLPFAHKVGEGSPAKEPKWQHCQTSHTISMHIANPTLYTESNLDFLPSGDSLCNILQSIHFKLRDTETLIFSNFF